LHLERLKYDLSEFGIRYLDGVGVW